ncbi:MAG: pyridoxal phosphate-dependent aminotransferase [Vicinamibacteria bacterium]|nr:pyridoxal phosphate-dependent aminotransferase [Vicinamibacteria bacterium]
MIKRERGEIELARRARFTSVSPTVAMAQAADARRQRGLEVIDLTIGEPDQPTPRHIVAAAECALRKGWTRYTSAAGLGELRAAVARRYNDDHALALDPDETMICCGGKHALYLVCQAILDRGDEVIVPSPHWPSFEQAVRLAGARPVIVRAEERKSFHVSARMIARAIGTRTRAVILNSPANPTSAVIAEEELLAIARVARRRRLVVLYDDAYARLIYGKTESAPYRRLRETLGERLVILGTASKTYCMTGWRIGWVLGSRSIVAACVALASHSTQCPTTFAQVGAIQALAGPQAQVHQMAKEYLRRRDAVLPALRAIPGVECVEPEGGFYLFPNVKAYVGARPGATVDFARLLLDRIGVGVVPGEAFGAPGHLRISFARPTAETLEGVSRMKTLLRQLGAS